MRSRVHSFLPAALLFASTVGTLSADERSGQEHDACPQPYVDGIAPAPYLNGLPIVGRPLEIVGDLAKVLVATTPRCVIVTPPGLPYEWHLIGPAGNEIPVPTGTLRPSITPPTAGTFEAKLTYCPRTCANRRVNRDVIDIPPQTASLRFEVVDQAMLPLSTLPVLTPTAGDRTARTLIDKDWRVRRCARPGGVAYNQLVALNEWVDASNYEVLEGTVVTSRIAGHDNALNHDSHDVGMHVTPDPRYERLLVAGARDMEVEWESDTMPDAMRPLANDRISAFGFYTLDCHHSGDHGILSEIHPAVLTAVHRPRPIEIPDGWAPPGGTSLGSDIFVPGIITDIWANRRAGEMTRGCVSSGLHQPRPSDAVPMGPCIQAPHPIRGQYSFNIYLPDNPRKRMAVAGIQAPPVPLYVAVEPPDPNLTWILDFDDGHMPHTPQPDDDVWFLHVTLDLPASVETSGSYQRRVKAAWVLPSENNWGLERWQFGVEALHVNDDHEPDPLVQPSYEVPGQWVLWVSLNNRDREWVQVYDKTKLRGGYTDLYRPNKQTEQGDTHGPDSLGPHLLLFNPGAGRFSGLPEQDPTRSARFAASGYEDDYILSDDEVGPIEKVTDLNRWIGGIPIGSRLEQSITSAAGDYRLDYFYTRLGPVGPARLDAAGRALVEAYTIRGDAPRCTPVRPGLCVLFPEGAAAAAWHPLLLPSSPQRAVSWGEHPLFQPQEAEPVDVTRMDLDELERSIVATRPRDPEGVERFLAELRRELDAARGTRRGRELARLLPDLEGHLPDDLWQHRFGDIDPTPVDLTVQAVAVSPPAATSGVPLVVSATVVNLGRGKSAPFTVALAIDGTAVAEVRVPVLGAGATTTVELPPWPATPGVHVARVEADAARRIAEPVEANNVRELRVTVPR